MWPTSEPAKQDIQCCRRMVALRRWNMPTRIYYTSLRVYALHDMLCHLDMLHFTLKIDTNIISLSLSFIVSFTDRQSSIIEKTVWLGQQNVWFVSNQQELFVVLTKFWFGQQKFC